MQRKAAHQAPLAEAILANAEPERPHLSVCNLFGGHREYIALDIETHALAEQTRADAPPSKIAARSGDRLVVFDRHSCGNESELRCVQIAVARGRLSDEMPLVKEWLVQPEGFEIDKAATEVHGITNEDAMFKGLPLKQVLEELLAFVKEAFDAGARVTAYNLCFDATVLRAEFERAGLVEEAASWAKVMEAGLCTMHPSIEKWLLEVGTVGGSHVYGLTKAVRVVLPRYTWMLRFHHDAVTDAILAWQLRRRLALDCGQASGP